MPPEGQQGEPQVPANPIAAGTQPAAPATPVEGQTPVAPVAGSPSGEAGGVEHRAGGESSSGAPPPETPPTTTPAWFAKRIDGMTARLTEEKNTSAALREHNLQLATENAALKAQLAAAGQSLATPGTTPPAAGASPIPPGTAPAANFQEEVQRQAEALLAQRKAYEEGEASAKRGKELYSDFEASLGQLKMVGPLPQVLIDMAMDTGGAHNVFYKMSKDLDLASRLVGITSPTKLALELSKLSSDPEAPPPPPPATPSATPPPMKPVGGKTPVANGALSMDMPLQAWLDKRTAEVAARKNGRIVG